MHSRFQILLRGYWGLSLNLGRGVLYFHDYCIFMNNFFPSLLRGYMKCPFPPLSPLVHLWVLITFAGEKKCEYLGSKDSLSLGSNYFFLQISKHLQNGNTEFSKYEIQSTRFYYLDTKNFLEKLESPI